MGIFRIAFRNIEGYSDEAREALEKVVKKRGGLESIRTRLF